MYKLCVKLTFSSQSLMCWSTQCAIRKEFNYKSKIISTSSTWSTAFVILSWAGLQCVCVCEVPSPLHTETQQHCSLQPASSKTFSMETFAACQSVSWGNGLWVHAAAFFQHWVFIVNDKMLWFSKIIFQQFPRSMCFFTLSRVKSFTHPPPQRLCLNSYTFQSWEVNPSPTGFPLKCSHHSRTLKHSIASYLFLVGTLELHQPFKYCLIQGDLFYCYLYVNLISRKFETKSFWGP